MRFLDIEFAPLFIPLERRLSTLAVVLTVISHLFNVIWSHVLAGYLILRTRFWWICILYLIWIYFIDTDLGARKRSEWVRSWSWFKYFQKYFPIQMVKAFEGDLNINRNYLFCYFPHGIVSFGASLTFGTNYGGFRKCFPHHVPYTHTLPLNFRLPFSREIGICMGSLSSSKKDLDYVLGSPGGGRVSCLVVGGAEEAFYTNPGVYKIVLKKRKGFVKLALKNGSPLVPTYGFGENEVYGQFNFEEGSMMRRFQQFFKKVTGIAFIFLKGRGIFQYTFGLLPHRRPITVVVGEPIYVEKTENPTQEQIDNLHQLFMEKLVELFESQKKNYIKDHETAHLEII